MFKRILVPVDGSPTSNKALTQALQLARDCGASVRLLHAVDELVYAGIYESGVWWRDGAANDQ